VAQDEVAFFKACVNGIMDVLKAIIEIHPKWVHKVTKDGEHCLHLAAIKGQTEVTTYMLQQGADPNIRSTFSAGLRMHPLSWNVYRGNYENVKVLLDGGANVNLDFDGLNEDQKVVTALDISTRLVMASIKPKGHEYIQDKFDITNEYLLDRGGKLYMEINNI
jgi:ankyrin repeat protein